jgi:VanZ family protein
VSTNSFDSSILASRRSACPWRIFNFDACHTVPYEVVWLKGWWIAVTAWVGVIFFSSTTIASVWCEEAFDFVSGLLFSGMPHDSSSYGIVHLTADKGLHVTLFLVLALLLYRAISDSKTKVAKILGFGFVVGCCSEYLQSFFPTRDPAVRDVFINVSGTALGLGICLLASRSPSSPVSSRAN